VAWSRALARAFAQSRRERGWRQRLAAWRTLRPADLRPVHPAIVEPSTGLSMGEHAEAMAREWQVTRAVQDELAAASHRNAAAAWREGFHPALVVPHRGLARDDTVRADTTRLPQLSPAFARDGTLTAGNSTPLTDGAAAVLLASEACARSRGWPVLAWLTGSAECAVDFAGARGRAEGLLMAPVHAVAQVLARRGLALADVDVVEMHEAFAAQVLANLAALASPSYCLERLGRATPLGTIDRARLNPHGGSIALGHPFAATGARLLGALAHDLATRDLRRGLVSVCTAGGMGVAALLER
jgi:acetyl-CoA C-acetyltransferase